jgi:DNA repair exonuclease SbcCD ATPase subunit
LLGGNLTGKNQKELAQIVEDLAKSLKFTQTALELVMQLQNRKHVVLKDFHAAVITKIENIQNDTTTLDGNQREATIYILSELRDNIADQIRYRELVDEHEIKFDQVRDFIDEKNTGDSEHDDIHDVLEARLNALSDTLESLSGVHAERFSGVQSLIDGIQSEISSYHQALTAVDSTSEKNMSRLTTLEELFHDRFSIKASIRRQILPVIALLVSIFAISLHFVHQR